MEFNLPLWLKRLNPIRYKATMCGHRTKRAGQISAFGQTSTVEMPKNDSGSVDYCLDCLSKMAIRCAWCANPIFIGEPITLYIPKDDFAVPAYAIIYNKDPIQLVGCLGWGCAHSGIDRAGFWLPGEDGNGRVQRVPSILQALFSAPEESMAIVEDTHNIVEALHPKIIPLAKKPETKPI